MIIVMTTVNRYIQETHRPKVIIERVQIIYYDIY